MTLVMAKNMDLLLKNVIFKPHHESGFFSGGFENQEFQNWHLCSMRVRSRPRAACVWSISGKLKVFLSLKWTSVGDASRASPRAPMSGTGKCRGLNLVINRKLIQIKILTLESEI